MGRYRHHGPCVNAKASNLRSYMQLPYHAHPSVEIPVPPGCRVPPTSRHCAFTIWPSMSLKSGTGTSWAAVAWEILDFTKWIPPTKQMCEPSSTINWLYSLHQPHISHPINLPSKKAHHTCTSVKSQPVQAPVGFLADDSPPWLSRSLWRIHRLWFIGFAEKTNLNDPLYWMLSHENCTD